MLEWIIFLLFFVSASITAVVSTFGWLIVGNQNEDLRAENEMQKQIISKLERDNVRLRAKLRFYRNLLEEKEDEQKSNQDING